MDSRAWLERFGGEPVKWLGRALALFVLLAGATAIAGPSSRYEGVATCSGATCHGRPEGNGKVVRQDEIAHWQDPASQSGAHSRAYAVLSSPRGQQIARTLGLGSAASAPECLGCHATNPPVAARGSRFQISDGVGCESCHGPAGGWLASHYTMAGSHAANVAAGLVPLDNPRARASVCLDCHFGSAKPGQFVSHRMMAAGHPRVSFELDLFSALQQHWDEDADYAKRKPRTDSVKLWAIGQAEAVRRSVSLFARGEGMQGIFPEFYFYDCHSCHRPIHDGPERHLTFETNPARPIIFGTPPYNDENITMLGAVAKALVPGEAASFDAVSRDFHAAMGKGRTEAVAAAGRLAAAADRLAGVLSGASYGGDAGFRAIAAISDKATAPRFTDYEGSVQAVMAVDTLLNALVKDGRVTVGAAAGIRANINRAYAAVKSPDGYNPEAFRAALADAAHAVEALK